MSRTLLQVGELALVDRIRSVIGRAGGSGIAEIGPGDDAAVVRSSAGRLVLSIDSQREFVHFERGWLEPRELGQRAAAVALSDIAAMGADPAWLLAALALPDATELDWVEELTAGMAETGVALGAPLVGGDVACVAGGVSIVVSAGGSLPDGREPLRRDHARAGDGCWVTGTPGLAGLGLDLLAAGRSYGGALESRVVDAYRRPVPRLELGARLADSPFRCAAMDLSDGLAIDVTRMCRASEVGVEIESERLADEPLRLLAEQLDRHPAELALEGGEDYELLLAVPRRAAQAFQEICELANTPARRVGTFMPGSPVVRIRDAAGRLTDPIVKGWDPFQLEGG